MHDAVAKPLDRYEGLPYPGLAFAQTHPNRLAVMAAFQGLRPAAPEKCKVLELGCGDAGNIIPMAFAYPQSAFVGIDLSARAVEAGRRTIGRLGLRNIELHAGDIMDFAPEVGPFDYIIAQGVYSWVPPAVRARMLAISRDHLAENGVVYVSYNCYPGSRMRDLTRDIMLFHTRSAAGPKQRLQQGREIVRALAAASNENTLYGAALRVQNERIRVSPDTLLYHDDLDAGATAFFLHEVAQDAARAGLQYLSDADSPTLLLDAEPPEVVNLIRQMPEDWIVERTQYLDFIKGPLYRESLFCHHEATLRRPVDLSALGDTFVAASLTAEPADFEPRDAGGVDFTSALGRRMSTDLRLAKAAFQRLAEAWPQAIAYSDLLAQALALSEINGSAEVDRGAEIRAFNAIILRARAAGLVDLVRSPPPVACVVSERPCASSLARLQAQSSEFVANLWHTPVALDVLGRRLLALLDGSRTIDQLAAAMQASGPQGADVKPGVTPPDFSPDGVAQSLRTFVKMALLVA